jgi:ATP-binding cassette, subfamily C (CFTR/MRP), member 1
VFIQVGIATFATYILSSDANVLTADKAFVSLALFNLLRGPLNAFPNVINSVIEVSRKGFFCGRFLIVSLQARVSNKRIQKFLSNEEIDENAVDRVPIGPGK